MLRTGALLQYEEGSQGAEEVILSRGCEKFHQNGDGVQNEEGETKPEEDHNGNGSADSPSEGQR